MMCPDSHSQFPARVQRNIQPNQPHRPRNTIARIHVEFRVVFDAIPLNSTKNRKFENRSSPSFETNAPVRRLFRLLAQFPPIMAVMKFAALLSTISLFREFSLIGRVIIGNDNYQWELFNNRDNAVTLFSTCFHRVIRPLISFYIGRLVNYKIYKWTLLVCTSFRVFVSVFLLISAFLGGFSAFCLWHVMWFIVWYKLLNIVPKQLKIYPLITYKLAINYLT